MENEECFDFLVHDMPFVLKIKRGKKQWKSSFYNFVCVCLSKKKFST